MKSILLIIACMMLFLSLTAQTDSTFVRYYYPTSQTSPEWQPFPLSQTMAANVFEAYDGNFVLQALATYHTPYTEWLIPQSPMMLYSRSGGYQDTLFGPQFGGDFIEGYYSRIVKDGLGGYLVLNSHSNRLQRLDANLQFVELVHLTCNEGLVVLIHDVVSTDDGFVIFGIIEGMNDNVIMKFNHSLESLWRFQAPVHSNATITTTSDGSYLFNWWYSPRMQLMKISAAGDSLWTREYNDGAYEESILECNGNYYGIRYYDDTVEQGLIKVYAYGADCSNVAPDTPLITIPTYRLLNEDRVFPAIRTSDNCIVLAVSTPTGEIFKFDSNFDLLWSSNALPIERIGVGKHPIMELENGDIVYCATIKPQNDQTECLAIVRIDSNGNYVGISDEIEPTPQICCLSVYPNPFSREITMNVNKNLLPASMLNIYNIKGQKIESIPLSKSYVTWIPKDAPSGLYIVKLVDGSKTIESRIISFIK